jgi:hypothetical protein
MDATLEVHPPTNEYSTMTLAMIPAHVPRYRYPLWTTLSIAVGALAGQRRSLARDSRRLAPGISTLRVTGDPRALLAEGGRALGARGLLITFNHFSRPGFRVWWAAIAMASVLDRDAHWVMSTAWTYPDWLRTRLLTPLSTWLFRRIARVYGFTSMPPMPPRPWEVSARAEAVREVLHWARAEGRPLIVLAPEGMDSPPGGLAMPPPGVGRFIEKLAQLGLAILPVGTFEDERALCLSFGKPYLLETSTANERHARDREVARIVMQHIAECLPPSLRSITDVHTRAM